MAADNRRSTFFLLGGAGSNISFSTGLVNSSGVVTVAGTQTTIASITAPAGSPFSLATLDTNQNIVLTPHGNGVIDLAAGGGGVNFTHNGLIKVGGVAVANTYNNRALYALKPIETIDTTEATSGGAGSIVTGGGIFAAKKINGAGFAVGAANGVSGTINAAATATVVNGIITNIV